MLVEAGGSTAATAAPARRSACIPRRGATFTITLLQQV